MRVRSSLVIGLSMLIASVSLWSCRVMAKARRRPRRTHPLTRPEQNKSAHDRLDLFDAPKALPSSTAFVYEMIPFRKPW